LIFGRSLSVALALLLVLPGMAARAHGPAMVMPKGTVLLSGREVEVAIRGTEMVSAKTYPGFSFVYTFNCDGTGEAILGGNAISTEQITYSISGEELVIMTQSRSEVSRFRMARRRGRFFLLYLSTKKPALEEKVLIRKRKC
jgi:hypothetical protein